MKVSIENLGQVQYHSRLSLSVDVSRVESLHRQMSLREGEILNEMKSGLNGCLSNLQTHKVSVSKIE